ncbi:TonB-dependent receptor, partial [Lysobacter sp. 2RAB21]
MSLAIASALIAPAAWAQDAAPVGEAKTLGGLTVTARKREETLQEVPISITACSPEAGARGHVEDLCELDAQVPIGP